MTCCGPGRGAGALPAGAAPSVVTGGAAEVMIRFEGGRSHLGTDAPEIAPDGEGPARPVRLGPFGLEAVAVTNDRFAAFVSATGHVTDAERYGWSAVFSGLMPPDRAARATPSGEVPWWCRVEGASWRHPEGPGSDLAARGDHPVTHVSWNDAAAFARWVGGRLPTEAEWEHAARGGASPRRFPWGEEEPDERGRLCNIWQGRFPDHNTGADGYIGTAPVRSFEPTAAGLWNMAGNVWEWTADPFRIRSVGRQAKARNAVARAQGQKVLKGGSFLCHASYCYRYRIAARMGIDADSSASNVGIRVAFD